MENNAPSEKIDVTKENYRKCPYCAGEFMTTHLKRKFCPGRNCKTRFHNRKLRQNHAAKRSLAALPEQEKSISPELKRNLEILQSFNVPESGIIQSAETIRKAGLDLKHYTERVSLEELLAKELVAGRYLKRIFAECAGDRFQFGDYFLFPLVDKSTLITRKTAQK